ncbi:MAG: hypothetical protein CMP39_01400 [Rickettsiales bacterium]|nr:hypothetical protein [Rickettsiales bacterium]
MKLALIGYGYWGKKCFETVSKIQGVSISYLVSSQELTGKQFKSIQVFRDWTEILSLSDLAGVIIAAPSAMHYPIAKECIIRNIPVFIEKPMTITSKESAELVDLAKKYQAKVVVDHILLFSPAFNAFKQYLQLNIKKLKQIDMFSGKWKPYTADISVLHEWAPHEVAMNFDIFQTDFKIKKLSQTRREFKDTYGQHITLRGSVNDIALSFNWSNLRKKPIRKIIAKFDDGELVFNDKIESKVIFKDLNGRIKKISYPDKAPLTIAIEVFKNHITNTEMNDSDVKLGHYVVKTIEEIDKKLKNINSLK